MALELNEHAKNAQVLAVAKLMALLLSSADSGYAHFFAVHIQPPMTGHSYLTAIGHQSF